MHSLSLYACIRLTADVQLHIRRWVVFRVHFCFWFCRARFKMSEDIPPAFLVHIINVRAMRGMEWHKEEKI